MSWWKKEPEPAPYLSADEYVASFIEIYRDRVNAAGLKFPAEYSLGVISQIVGELYAQTVSNVGSSFTRSYFDEPLLEALMAWTRVLPHKGTSTFLVPIVQMMPVADTVSRIVTASCE